MTKTRMDGDAENAARQGRKIQDHIDALDARGASQDGAKSAMQVGQRRYPERFPPQHLEKSGSEAELEKAPMYDAPGYKGSDKLSGMVALITGGDSGIGRAVAVLFAREGADVAILYLEEHEDARITQQAVQKEGRRCILIAGDVADPHTCENAVQSALNAFGRLDVLVNNAAFQQHANNILDITNDHFDRTLKTNLYGYFYLARAAVPHINHGGSIIMVGSVTGIQGSEDLLDYSMTKGGIHAFARSLSSQLIERGIRVNVIAPGPVWTPLNPADKAGKDVAAFGSKTPMKRAAQPEEIAPAVVFMAAPSCSSYITGEVLPIVGGYHN